MFFANVNLVMRKLTRDSDTICFHGFCIFRNLYYLTKFYQLLGWSAAKHSLARFLVGVRIGPYMFEYF